MFIDWFCDKKIDVYSYAEYEDKYGISRDGYVLKQEAISVDIQPIGAEKIKADYGYDIEANYRMYSSEVLEESDVVVWNNKTYQIEKIIAWDDYCVYLLKEEVINLGL